MGAGGVGGYFGGLLTKAGEDVTFIARGQHLRAIRRDGLRIQSPRGDFSVRAKASEDPAEVGPVDLVLFCVKGYDTVEAAMQTKPMVSTNTTVISLQNGVDKEEILGRILGVDRIMGGLCALNAYIESPGVITHLGLERLAFGETDGTQSERGKRILEMLENAGINASLSQNILVEEWEKFAFISAVGGLCCLTRLPLGPILEFEETRLLYINTLSEILAVGRNEGVALDDDVLQKLMRFSSGLDPDLRPSMYRDLKAEKRIEIETLNGAVVQLGRESGTPTPTNDFIYACLKVVNEVNLRRGNMTRA